MSRTRKCPVCGREFEARHKSLMCSDECRAERKRRQRREWYRKASGDEKSHAAMLERRRAYDAANSDKVSEWRRRNREKELCAFEAAGGSSDMTWKKWPACDVARMVEMLEGGASVVEVAVEMGRTPNAVRMMACKAKKSGRVAAARAAAGFCEEDMRDIAEMAASGFTLAEAAAEMGVPEQVVEGFVRGVGKTWDELARSAAEAMPR